MYSLPSQILERCASCQAISNNTKNQLMNFKVILLAFTTIFTTMTYAQDWKFYQKTSIKGSVSGSITKGYLFKTSDREFFEITERTRQRVRERNPDVTIYKSGNDYKL